jgi:recombination protein RecA
MRKRLGEKANGADNDYFKPATNIEFIRSGCVLFDCMLGGGWPLGRMSNLVGDKSTGKTLCAIEAAANFARQYPNGHIWYREAEAAFDESYAGALGLPVDRVDFGPEGLDSAWETVEDIFEDLTDCCERAIESKEPGLYIIDSLDALSSRAELARKIDEGSYGMEKQKQLGQLFRRLTRKLKEARIALLIISQVRDKIGISFGDKHRRSGGRAMDFYASLVVYLSHLKQLSRTIGGIKRPTAIHVRAKCQKNKIAMPFRECEFTLRFGYGIDEMDACVTFLEMAKATKLVPELDKNFMTRVDKLNDADYKKQLIVLRKATRKAWRAIEVDFAPTRRKYV